MGQAQLCPRCGAGIEVEGQLSGVSPLLQLWFPEIKLRPGLCGWGLLAVESRTQSPSHFLTECALETCENYP